MSPLVKKKSQCRKGNPSLKKALIQGATGAVKKKGSFPCAKYKKLTVQTGSKNKAKVGVANWMAKLIYCILSDDESKYKELGSHRVFNNEKKIKYHLEQLRKLGTQIDLVTFEKIEAVVKI
jgi:hypothetical protein